MEPVKHSPQTTPAYYVQSLLSFVVALAVVVGGEIWIPAPAWTRAFLAIGTLFLVSSTFTLAKTVRDRQESTSTLSRLDQARLERLLIEFDPYRMPGESPAPAPMPMAPAPVSMAPAPAPQPTHFFQ